MMTSHMKTDVLILTGGHLSTAPRVQKEALYIAEAGYSVLVVGKWDDPELARWDEELLRDAPYRFLPVVDMRPSNIRVRFLARLERKIAELLHSSYALAYGLRHYQTCMRIHNPRLIIAHFPGGLFLAQARVQSGGAIAVDFEDWFSENLPQTIGASYQKKALERFEKILLKKAVFTTCPTASMAEALHATHGGSKPIPIINAFVHTRSVNHDKPANVLRVLWFSQTIGKDRGLETVCAALEKVTFPLKLTLIGRCTTEYKQKLIEALSVNSLITFSIKPPLPPWELEAEISCHDIGLALELTNLRSRNLTASNKFFQYLSANLAIIATKTIGQLEMWPDTRAPGICVEVESATDLHAALSKFFSDRLFLDACKQNAATLADRYSPDVAIAPTIKMLVKKTLG